MTNEIIEQTNMQLFQSGGSKFIRIPANWLEKLNANTKSEFKVRLVKGKHGIFIDAYTNKRG